MYQSPDRSQDQFNLTQGKLFWTPYWIFSIQIKIQINKTNKHCINTQHKTSHQKLLIHKMQKLPGCLTYSRRWQITGVQTWWSWKQLSRSIIEHHNDEERWFEWLKIIQLNFIYIVPHLCLHVQSPPCFIFEHLQVREPHLKIMIWCNMN